MIILKSNFSPACACEDLERENIQMLNMLLYFALPPEQLDLYTKYSERAAYAYEKALNETDGDTEARYDAAKEATIPDRHTANAILEATGVTIENKLIRPMIDGEPVLGQFCWIETTVFKGYDDHQAVAKIERAITDIEATTYVDNSVGYVFNDSLSAMAEISNQQAVDTASKIEDAEVVVYGQNETLNGGENV